MRATAYHNTDVRDNFEAVGVDFVFNVAVGFFSIVVMWFALESCVSVVFRESARSGVGWGLRRNNDAQLQ